jgi:hypothetical protein
MLNRWGVVENRAEVTRLIALQRRTGRVQAAVYQRTKFATRCTAA